MFTLARETGWTESFLLWELPLPRALQYMISLEELLDRVLKVLF